jgi:hypothetical protein
MVGSTLGCARKLYEKPLKVLCITKDLLFERAIEKTYAFRARAGHHRCSTVGLRITYIDKLSNVLVQHYKL